MTLEPDTLVAYKVTCFYDKASDGAVLWSSPELAIDWPVQGNAATLSEKDENALSFSDFVSPF
jgi:dTDP-4-dehydrorhamnose 3,5-epimerase